MESNMHNKRIYRVALALSLLFTACGDDGPSGYGSDGDNANSYGSPPVRRDASTGSSASTRDAGASGDETPEVRDAGVSDATVAAVADLVLRSGAAFQNYLADRQGRPLYFFANDVPAS